MLGSPIVPGEHCKADTHDLLILSAKSPPVQLNSHLNVFGSAYKSGFSGHLVTHYQVELSDHKAMPVSHKDLQNFVLLSA